MNQNGGHITQMFVPYPPIEDIIVNNNLVVYLL